MRKKLRMHTFILISLIISQLIVCMWCLYCSYLAQFASDRADAICEYMVAPIRPEYAADARQTYKLHKAMLGTDDKGI